MKKFKKLASALPFAVVFLAIASPSLAKSAFLVQLGSAPSASEAREKWELLKKSFSDELAALPYVTAPVDLPESDVIIYRVQAGPIANRDLAYDICSSLLSRDAECSVVETALLAEAESPVSEAPPMAAVQPALPEPAQKPSEPMQKTADAAPAAAPKAESAAPAKEESFSPSWLTSPFAAKKEAALEKKAEAPSSPPSTAASARPEVALASASGAAPALAKLAPAAGGAPPERPLASASGSLGTVSIPKDGSRPGQVKVAEAIRVPLTSAAAAATATTAPSGRGSYPRAGGTPSQDGGKDAVWVHIRYFGDEPAARGFWEDIITAQPQLSSFLRARVTKPYLADPRRQRVSLRAGPVTEDADIVAICGYVRMRAPETLSCSAVRELGRSVGVAAAAPQQRSYLDRHEANRAARQANAARSYADRRENEGRFGSLRAAPIPGRSAFWAQFGSASSAGEAKNRWQAIKSAHSDLLGRHELSLSVPPRSSSYAAYRVRTGPFANRGSAESLCASLRTRRVSCLVLSDF